MNKRNTERAISSVSGKIQPGSRASAGWYQEFYKDLAHTVVGAEQASPNSMGWATQKGQPQFLGMAEDSVRDTVSAAAAALRPLC